MNKEELKAKLTELGIPFAPDAKVSTLKGLLSQHSPEFGSVETPSDEEVDSNGIIVGDPQILRPVELPLVVKLPKGKTWTAEQQEYVNVLNAYAYKNPTKWQKKKDELVKRLVLIGSNPELLAMYKGGLEGNLSYSNKIINPEK